MEQVTSPLLELRGWGQRVHCQVSASSPLGTLSGSDNLVEIYSQWYAATPLVLRGAGAGAGTTAAGVLSDMVELANTRG